MNPDSPFPFVIIMIAVQIIFMIAIFRFAFKHIGNKFKDFKTNNSFPQNHARLDFLKFGNSSYKGLVKIAIQGGNLYLKMPFIFPLAIPLNRIHNLKEMKSRLGIRYFTLEISKQLPPLQIGISKQELNKLSEFDAFIKKVTLNSPSEDPQFETKNTISPSQYSSNKNITQDPAQIKEKVSGVLRGIFLFFLVSCIIAIMLYFNTFI